MKDAFKIAVGKRLRLTANSVGFATTSDFARYLGSERGRVDAWFNGQTLTPVKIMAGFAKAYGLTLDWIYLGALGGLAYDKAITLQSLLDGSGITPSPVNGVPDKLPLMEVREAVGAAAYPRPGRAKARVAT